MQRSKIIFTELLSNFLVNRFERLEYLVRDDYPSFVSVLVSREITIRFRSNSGTNADFSSNCEGKIRTRQFEIS